MMKRMIAWVLVLTLMVSVMPQLSLGAAAEGEQAIPAAHSHTAAQHDCEHCEETVTWTAWDKTDALPTDSGHYYLTAGVKISAQTKLTGTTDQVICLNGYTIDGNSKLVWYLQDTAKLTVSDCTAYTDAEGVFHAGTVTKAKQSGQMGAAIYAKNGATLSVYNCIFTGNTLVKNDNSNEGYGGTIQLRGDTADKTATLYLENVLFDTNTSGQSAGAVCAIATKTTAKAIVTAKKCTFKNNTALQGGAAYLTSAEATFEECAFEKNSAENGAAIYAKTCTKLTLKNCTISKNAATKGAAIHVNKTPALIEGSTLEKNTAKGSGGSTIHIHGTGGDLTLKDSTIKENVCSDKSTDYRGAVYVTNKADNLTLAGKVVFQGNYKHDADGNQVPTAVYVQDNPNPIDLGGLTEGAKVSVETRKYEAADLNEIFSAATAPTAWDEIWLTYMDKQVDYSTEKGFHLYEEPVTPPSPPEPDHAHCQCGEAACAAHEMVEYSKWEDATSLPTSGNYYLNTDVVLAGETSVTADLNLCLNGHTVKAADGKRHISTVKNTNVIIVISDCTATYDTDGNYTAGKLTGGVDTSGNSGGGAIYIRTASTLKIFDGILTGNTSTTGGGAIFLNEDAKLEMYDGLLDSNTAVSADGKTWKVGGNIDSYKADIKIYGGTIKNGSGVNGGGIYGNGGTVTITGGTICGNHSTRDGAGIYMKTGVLTITGGTVCHNETDSAGGGICYGSNSSGTVSGCVIEENKAPSAAGMIIQNGADVTITDVTVRNNAAQKSGGGIRLVNAKLKLTGGTITGNTAGTFAAGMILEDNGQLELGGNVTIFGNTANGIANNLYLEGGVVFAIDSLGDNTRIGISVEKVFRAISTETETDYSAKFVSDKANMQVVYQDKALYIGASGDHKHCLCAGLSSVGCTHDAMPFAEWDDPNSLPASGNWYLATDVSLTNRVEVYDELNLCLNGHTITANGVENAGTDLHFKVMNQGTLSITDCTENPGKLTGGTFGSVLFNWDTSGGSFNLYNGIITGNESRSAVAGAVKVQCSKEEGNTFNMYGGKITGNADYAYLKKGEVLGGKGGGVYVLRSTFNMYGGEISGNQAVLLEHEGKNYGGRGGGVYAETAAKVNLYGGKISGNTATADGGGLYVISKNTVVTLDGTEISGNTAKNGGGMITATASHLEFKGGKVSQNKASVSGGGLYISTITTMTMTGGEISGNTASVSGGGVAMYKSTATFKGGKITGNKANTSGGGIYLNQKEALAVFDGTEVSRNSSKNGGGMIVVTLATAELKSGKFTGNTTTSSGAGIYVSTNSKLKMTGGQVTGNTAKSSGGGIYCLRSTATLSGGSVSYNKAKDGGGVISTGATVYLYGTAITGNTATNSGGGVKTGNTDAKVNGVKTTFRPNVVIGGSYISNNTAKNGGGVLFAGAGGTLKMTGGTISNNEATASGGGAYISTNTNFNMTGGTIKNNKAKNGAAVYHLKCKVKYSDVEIYGNEASASAGAFYFTGGANWGKLYPSELTNVKIIGNKATGETSKGGAVYANVDLPLTFVDCQISDNYATQYGGGIYALNGAKITLLNCSVTGNETGENGGGLMAWDFCELVNTEFSGNKAQRGAGVFAGNPYERYAVNGFGSKGDSVGMTITDCTFVDNDASIDGGGLHLDMSCYTTIHNTTFTGNTAGQKGSAMWLWENTTMEDVTVTGNVCADNGYAVYLADSEFDGQTYINGLFKFGGDMIIKDNEGGDLFLDNKVTIGETNREYGPKTHMCVTLDAGLLTQRVLGVYNYEGGDLVYTITYGDRSMTDPEYDPSMVQQADAWTQQQTQQKTANQQDIWLYAGVGAVALIVLAAVLLIVKKKKATKSDAAKKD